MLMKELDQSGDNEQINKALQIKKHIESFEGIRTRFEKTYSESRMLGNPAGYQLDSNFHHHLANGSNNTDWMYLYELPMNKKIMEWLSKLGI
jgi:hypothetical protein